MQDTLCTAKTLYDLYYRRHGEYMDEMKMHKLMYFSQREALMTRDEPLFDGTFYGYKFGPVLKEVREMYQREKPFADITGKIPAEDIWLLEEVEKRYGSLSSWKLSRLSHEEFSWKDARAGLRTGEEGYQPMSLDAIRVDAVREIVARKAAYV